MPGWYAIGFADESGHIDLCGAVLAKHIGDGQWENESGDPIESFYDPTLNLSVATNAADAYLPQ